MSNKVGVLYFLVPRTRVTTFAQDLAKQVFQLHSVEAETGEVKRPRLKRG